MNYLILFSFFIFQIASHSLQANDWISSKLLLPTLPQNAKTAILIIAPPKMKNSLVEYRWILGQKVWEQYMNSHPHVDCFFIQSTYPRPGQEKDQVWREGNTIYVGDWWYEKQGNDRLLYKTVAVLETLLPYYTHFIRTNLNTFFDLNAVDAYMSTHPQSFFTTPLWEAWYPFGYSIMCTKDVAAHIANEYRRLEQENEPLIDCRHADDSALTALATGIWPLTPNNPFQCCPSLPFQAKQLISNDSTRRRRSTAYGMFLTPPLSLKEALQYSNQAPSTLILYRIKNDLSLLELADLYQHLLHKHYPGLSPMNLAGYIQSLPPLKNRSQ